MAKYKETVEEVLADFEPEGADPPYHVLSDKIRGQHFKIVSILNRPSVSAVVAGFIYRRTGILANNPEVVVRSRQELNDELKTQSLPLFNKSFLNPALLKDITAHSDLDPKLSARLQWLALHNRYYQGIPPLEWRQGRAKIDYSKNANRALHDLLSMILFLYREAPDKAFDESQKVLDRFVAIPPTDLDCLAPEAFRVPFYKGLEASDDIRYADFIYDRRRIALLGDSRFTIVVGGSPKSGKSTFTASLCRTMQEQLEPFYRQGVLDRKRVSVGLCDLDRASPTSEYIYKGLQIPADRKRPWDEELVDEALFFLDRSRERHSIVVADLPGGVPDRFTAQLVKGANFSIWVDKTIPRRDRPWQQFLLGPHLPDYLIGVHTRYKEPERASAAKRYESRYIGKREEFLSGRVVNLERQLKLDDPFINLAARALLFDFLPEQVLWTLDYGSRIIESLDITKMKRPHHD